MAKFTDYTQKTKPADADLLLIHDNAGAANKKTPFSGVWSWISDKLASAVISQLETKNKSIIPAINELNSNFKMDSNVTIDCNEVTDFLTFCNNDSQNLPVKNFGILMTLTRDQNVRLQIFGVSTAENHMYTRTKIGSTWTAWYRFQLQPVEQS